MGRYMDRLSLSIDVSISVAVAIVFMHADIILGTVRVDLHTTVVAIIVDIKAVGGGDGVHRLVVARKHNTGGRADSAGEVNVRKKEWGKWGLRRTLRLPRCQGGLQNTVNAGNDMLVIGWQRPRPFDSL